MVSAIKNFDEATILSRAIRPDEGDWSAEVANGILSISLSPGDCTRMHELAALARDGSLSAEEEVQIENYRQAARLLELLKMKARLSLVRSGKAR